MYYFVYHINTIVLGHEKSTLLMNENKKDQQLPSKNRKVRRR